MLTKDVMDNIIPHLYISNFYAAEDLNKLKENNITHILNLCEELEPRYTDLFTYKWLKLVDDEE
jgi:hypothetical protein